MSNLNGPGKIVKSRSRTRLMSVFFDSACWKKEEEMEPVNRPVSWVGKVLQWSGNWLFPASIDVLQVEGIRADLEAFFRWLEAGRSDCVLS